MKVFKLLAAIAFVAVVSGCGMSSYLTSNQNQNSTTVVLSDNNYSIVGTVEASASASYVFGIGGLSKKALYANAMSELSKQANLQGSQALINISTKTHVKSILVWMQYTVVTSGTIIEFKDKQPEEVKTPVVQQPSEPSVQKVVVEVKKPELQKGKPRYKDYLAKASDIDSAIRYRKIKEARILMNELKVWYDSYEEPNKLIEEDMESLERTLENLEK